MSSEHPRRVAMLSAHTSPLEQPGDGDAGGMNVYVLELARRLAARDIAVEVFTRATSRHQPPTVEAAPGVLVRHVAAGPFEGLGKDELPAQMCAVVREVLRAEAVSGPAYVDVVHSHYWLSGQVGSVVSERWDVPLVHSMHTLAKVKNASLALGDRAEPAGRIAGESEIVRVADRLIANTADERDQLVGLYDADPSRIDVIAPGVDLDVFVPRPRAQARREVGLPTDAAVVLFAGRIQPLKAPDVVIAAAAELLARDPSLRGRLVVPIVGGMSGSGLERPTALTELTATLGLTDEVRFVPTMPQTDLARWYAAADVVCVPSYNESFGLVAIEAQACGTPVVAARVGGLPTAVSDQVSGVLVDGHDPADYAAAIAPLLSDVHLAEAMGAKAVAHAEGFGWDATAERTLASYRHAIATRRAHV